MFQFQNCTEGMGSVPQPPVLQYRTLDDKGTLRFQVWDVADKEWYTLAHVNPDGLIYGQGFHGWRLVACGTGVKLSEPE